ncbi:MAG: GTPase ObgE [Deltaproteobacteria bacterium]|nr:GTPase ObgE [Deltaproteobacteria bacterium]
MKFIDEARILVTAGHGGRGCVSFRREKYVPRGGPDGGNGGEGGDVLLQAHPRRSTLMHLKGKYHFRAKAGAHGGGKGMHGARGKSEIVEVPMGTVIKDSATGKVLADLTEEDQSFIAAKGGLGGRGNQSFVSSTNRAPSYAQPGEPGQERELILELKLLADVGLIGRPNAGKSTLLASISAAKPKVADYPFTTLKPQLGVVSWGDFSSFTVADIPGLIEGASQGAGMGIKFLKHIERTKVFLHLLDLSDLEVQEEAQDLAWQRFQEINQELLEFSPQFKKRTQWVALSKADAVQDQEFLKKIREFFEKKGYRCFVMSAVTKQGIEELLKALGDLLSELSSEQEKDQNKVCEQN